MTMISPLEKNCVPLNKDNVEYNDDGDDDNDEYNYDNEDNNNLITIGEELRPSPSMRTTSFPCCTRSATSRANLVMMMLMIIYIIPM